MAKFRVGHGGGPGQLTVTGAGSSLTNANILGAGWAGTGTLTIANGGQATGVFGIVGEQAGVTGAATHRSSTRQRARERIGRNALAERLLGRGELRGRVLEPHPRATKARAFSDISGNRRKPASTWVRASIVSMASHTAARSITPRQRVWRRTLVTSMRRQGSVNYSKEWWHFSLPGAKRGAYDFPIAGHKSPQ